MAQPSPPDRAVSVLVVEDNQDAADSLARFFRVALGYHVRVAYDGAAGIRMAVADPPDVVVCDIALPRLDGFQVATDLVAKLARKPLLIAVTAFSGDFPEDKARQAG